MSRHPIFFRAHFIAALTALLICSYCSAAPTYTITPLESPAGADFTTASVLNNQGMATGSFFFRGHPERPPVSWNSSSPQLYALPQDASFYSFSLNNNGIAAGEYFTDTIRAATLDAGSVVVLPTPFPAITDFETRARGINSSGDVVGQWQTGSAFPLAVLWHNHSPILLPTPSGAYASYTGSINDADWIAGAVYSTIDFHVGPVLWHDGQRFTLPLPAGATGGDAHFINNSNQVIGLALFPTDDGQDSFIRWVQWSGDTVTILPNPGGTPTSNGVYIMGLNNSGSAVGWADTSGYLWQDDQLYNLNDLIPADSGWSLSSANAINDSGQIIGDGNFNGQNESFLLTPNSIPEPSAVLLILPAILLYRTRRP